jgi:hypothetical protein
MASSKRPVPPKPIKDGPKKKSSTTSRTGTADTMSRAQAAALKGAGNYYSGRTPLKPETSADTKAGRGKARISRTISNFGSEGPKRSGGIRKRGSEGPTIPAVRSSTGWQAFAQKPGKNGLANTGKSGYRKTVTELPVPGTKRGKKK